MYATTIDPGGHRMTRRMTDLELACSLDPKELRNRRTVWESLARAALRDQHATPTGVRLVYSASDEAERLLRELARLEADCCSFADWHVERRDDDVLLDVTSEGDGIAAVRALFGLPSAVTEQPRIVGG
jgi:hypothetical protein